MATQQTIRAAGAVLWRPSGKSIELLVVHRPHRHDWTFAKGKLEHSEHAVVAATREVEEETGYLVALGRPLPTLRYPVEGVPKQVRYWAAPADDDHRKPFEPSVDGEVDALRWLPLDETRERLTYKHDSTLLDALMAGPLDTVPLVVARHAKAVKRSAWTGPVDIVRPLLSRGLAQADRLVPVLRAYGIRAVHSSSATRCVQTLQPYAASIGVDVVDEPDLTEEINRDSTKPARRRARQLLVDPEPLVVCTHRPVLPDLLGEMLDGRHFRRVQRPLAPGSVLVLHRDLSGREPRVVAVERHQV
jgi:8-oxo-dGTP diphosphatase